MAATKGRREKMRELLDDITELFKDTHWTLGLSGEASDLESAPMVYLPGLIGVFRKFAVSQDAWERAAFPASVWMIFLFISGSEIPKVAKNDLKFTRDALLAMFDSPETSVSSTAYWAAFNANMRTFFAKYDANMRNPDLFKVIYEQLPESLGESRMAIALACRFALGCNLEEMDIPIDVMVDPCYNEWVRCWIRNHRESTRYAGRYEKSAYRALCDDGVAVPKLQTEPKLTPPEPAMLGFTGMVLGPSEPQTQAREVSSTSHVIKIARRPRRERPPFMAKDF